MTVEMGADEEVVHRFPTVKILLPFKTCYFDSEYFNIRDQIIENHGDLIESEALPRRLGDKCLAWR